MRLRLNIFARIFLAFSALALLPLLVSSALIVSIYQEMSDEMVDDAADEMPPTVARHLLEQVADVHHNAYILLIFVLLISVILVVFAALFLSRSFSSPTKALLQASQHLARGDLDVRLKTDRTDEFAALAEGFNEMAGQLQEAKVRMEKANTELEQRVAERTAELTMANVELRASAAQIREANRLKSEFLANMSHELRTPLNAILGYTDLLLDGIYAELTQPQKESMNKVRRNAESLLRLINDILDLSKIEAGRMSMNVETFDPGDLLTHTVASVRPLFDRKNLQLHTEIGRNLPAVEADRGKVQQVLFNLLSNALKFTRQGVITVRVYAAVDRQLVWYEVADTGEGIAADKLQDIFDQFRQIDGSTTRAAGGTGLGLALCKKLVSLLDGTMEVESETQQGSTFRFSVPVKASPPEQSAASRRRRTLGNGPKVVLAIDDDEETLALLADSLEPAGYRVVRCTDGDTGVRQACELTPYAVTLDIMMPHRDGWSVLQELKARPETANIPVVIVSIIDDRARGYRLGVDEYMVKPVNRRELIERLDSLSARNSL